MSGEAEAEVLAAGAEILGQVLELAGFRFHPGAHAKGSGVRFAVGRFVRHDQYIELQPLVATEPEPVYAYGPAYGHTWSGWMRYQA